VLQQASDPLAPRRAGGPPSGTAVFRLIEAHQPTLLIDEADTFLPENEALRGVLNSGFWKPKAYVSRCVGDDYAPMERALRAVALGRKNYLFAGSDARW
jgi:hypothetical protein